MGPPTPDPRPIATTITLVDPATTQASVITAASTTAIALSNQASQLSASGLHAKAIRLHTQALALKLQAYGDDSVQAAVTYNSLGEDYLMTGQLDEAEFVLRRALRVRDDGDGGLGLGPRNDAAATRDNLAQVLEARGRGGVMCGNIQCATPGGAMMSKDELMVCGACKCVFYCSVDCQRQDWLDRHKPLCKAYLKSVKRSSVSTSGGETIRGVSIDV
ncbi:hypothetical protein B0T17DRAFT_255845 [Bombardia bombarda]|uniref:MYND-type domain-containing protein n=1 Tax=Bombardia bombarda TaxID=252184 RepID=A0AA39X0A7_9PEZI|nr:hypothetical protein B0T17DRAFT_255845 [Bombardia bombarda]